MRLIENYIAERKQSWLDIMRHNITKSGTFCRDSNKTGNPDARAPQKMVSEHQLAVIGPRSMLQKLSFGE